MTDSAAEEIEEVVDLDAPTLAYGCPTVTSLGQPVIFPNKTSWLDTATALLNDGWNMCTVLTAVDYSAAMDRELPSSVTPERFEIVADFISHAKKKRLRARIQVSESDPTIDSLYSLYPGTDFQEREVFDMFGITFVSHPDLSRILMPEEWKGHPLRKDYAVGSIPVQFKHPAGDKS